MNPSPHQASSAPDTRQRHRREVLLTRGLLCWSLIASVLAFNEVAAIGWQARQGGHVAMVASQALFAICLLVMLLGSWAYLIPRAAYYRRCLTPDAPAPALRAMGSSESSPSLTVLVPSYKEELPVIRQTLLSAALQAVPGLRVVLLIDDPQPAVSPADAQALLDTRTLVQELQAQFDRLAARLQAIRTGAAACDAGAQSHALAQAHACALGALREICVQVGQADHTARWLNEVVLSPLARQHEAFAQQRALNAAEREVAWDRLMARYEVQLSCFERKRYANLSHEPNKAMNLNAYLALMGGHYHEVQTAEGGMPQLLPCPADAPDALSLPDAEFVLTLDADSLLLPDYAFTLLQLLQRPEHARTAVIQTPYSAIPGAASLCERVAGAQTDIQYIMHQGFTAYGATFWVGANALLRKRAIEDIATVHHEHGLWVKRYIHDRTVIEDTESSIDLVDKGWQLHNHNERLAYSATPPDFGSLLIQRRRWADGGLIILPKALRYLARGPWTSGKVFEAFLRVHYLSSIATVNLAFLLMMFGPFSQNMSVIWIPLAMAAYMVAYARDLRHCGYDWVDFARVYALNLLLLPVHLGGTVRSLYQVVTGQHAAFARTPKVVGRTAMPGAYVLFEWLMLGSSVLFMVSDLWLGRWVEASLSSLYVMILGYGCSVFIGWRAGWEDLSHWLFGRRVAQPKEALEGAGSQMNALDSEWRTWIDRWSDDAQTTMQRHVCPGWPCHRGRQRVSGAASVG